MASRASWLVRSLRDCRGWGWFGGEAGGRGAKQVVGRDCQGVPEWRLGGPRPMQLVVVNELARAYGTGGPVLTTTRRVATGHSV